VIKDLIVAVSRETEIAQKDVRKIFTAIFSEIRKLAHKNSGKSIKIQGFGTFREIKKKARTGRNPQTGEKMKIASRLSLRFRESKKTKKAE